MNHQQWYTEQDTEKQTPLLLADILHLVKKGELQRSSILIDAEGNHVTVESVLIMDHAEYTESESNQSDMKPADPPKPPLPPSGMTVSVKRPWNPLAIAWLGLLFTPAWTGIMAAINTGRLKSDQPLWRPLAIGIGSTVLWILLSCAGLDYILLDILFMTVPLIVIWNTDLAQQEEAYSEESPKSQDHWILPVLAGSPIALLMIIGIGYALFRSDQPREVCNMFIASETPAESRKYVTKNMYSLINQIKRIETLTKQFDIPDQPEDDADIFELTDESEAPSNMTGYLVGCRTFIPDDDGDSLLLDGFFHLTNYNGDWKIEEWYLTTINGEPVGETPVSMTQFWKNIADKLQKQVDGKSDIVQKQKGMTDKHSMYNYGIDETKKSPDQNSSKPSIKSSIGSELNKHKDTLVKGKGVWFLSRGLYGLLKGGGLKKIGGGILFIIAAAGATLSRGFGGGGKSK